MVHPQKIHQRPSSNPIRRLNLLQREKQKSCNERFDENQKMMICPPYPKGCQLTILNWIMVNKFLEEMVKPWVEFMISWMTASTNNPFGWPRHSIINKIHQKVDFETSVFGPKLVICCFFIPWYLGFALL